MDRTALAQQLDVAVTVHAQEQGVPRKDVVGAVAEAADVARSTIRQDLAGHIKRPAPHRLATYSRVLGCPMQTLMQAADSEGIAYDLTGKGRDEARSPSDLEYSGTTEGEWTKPDWSEWQDVLGIDTTWSETSEEDRRRVAKTTLFGGPSADTFADANWYPLVEPGEGLNANALDSAWKLAGRAPDPEGVRRTVESLANDEFDMSFRDEEESSRTYTFASPDLSTGDKVGWSTSSDSINTYGTIREIHENEGDISPPNSDYTLNSDDAPVFRTEVYDVDQGEHTGTETIHRAGELTPMDSFPDGDKHGYSQAPNIQFSRSMDALNHTLSEKSAPEKVAPFTDKLDEDQTEFKGSADAEVKDVDRDSNVVTGYYAAWTSDSVDDRFEKGAFEESIEKFGPQADKQRIVHLNQHLTKQPIGRPITLREDNHGLYFETAIADTRKGRDVLALYNEGVISEHSVGFQRQEEREEEKDTVIEKALLLEGSNVTWGANSDTPFTGFKSGKQAIEELVNYASNLKSALREDLTQTTARKVEHGIDAIESELRRLMGVAAHLAEQAEHANADPIKKGDLDTALRSFKDQMGAIEDGNDPNTRNRDEGSDVNVPDFSEGEKDDDSDVTDLVPDTDFFGRNA